MIFVAVLKIYANEGKNAKIKKYSKLRVNARNLARLKCQGYNDFKVKVIQKTFEFESN